MDSDPGLIERVFVWIAGGIATLIAGLSAAFFRLFKSFVDTRFDRMERETDRRVSKVEKDVDSTKADVSVLRRHSAEHDTEIARLQVEAKNAKEQRNQIISTVNKIDGKLDHVLLQLKNGNGTQ